MSDLIVIQPQVTELTVTEDVNQVVVSSVGLQGPAGATGAKGDTGDQGPSGVIDVTAPITNSGTSTSANIGISATALVKPVLKKTSGIYYRTAINLANNAIFVNQRVYYSPVFVDSTTVFDRLAIRTGPSYGGTGSVRIGIYNNTDGFPSTLILDAGTVATTATNTVYQITISQSLDAGFYWLAFCQQASPATPQFLGVAANITSLANQNSYITGSSLPNGNGIAGVIQSSVSGAFSDAASLSYSDSIAFVWIRAQ